MVVTTDTSGTYLKAVNYNYNYIISAEKGVLFKMEFLPST